MRVAQGDYVIVKVTNKPALARVQVASTEKKKYKAVLEKEYQTEENPVPFDFSPSEVMANLGSSPKPGKVFGVNVEVLHDRKESDFYGTLNFLRDFDDDQLKSLRRGMKAVSEEWDRRKLPRLPIQTTIKFQEGKYAGWYKTKGGEVDTMCVMPPEDMSSLTYILSHELAHGIWARHMTPNMRFSWVKLYHKIVTIQEVTEKQLRVMRKELEESGDLIEYMRELDDEGLELLKAVIKYVKTNHSLDRKHLQMALTIEGTIEEYWPLAIELSSKEVAITEYATKSPEECFAEAFSLHFSGKKLPKSYAELLDRTLRSLTK